MNRVRKYISLTGVILPFLLMFVFVLFAGMRNKKIWTSDQEAKANNLIKEYQDTFEFFASVHDEGKGASFMFKLQDLFTDQRARHYYDLFEEENPGSEDIEDYLFTIKNEYQCNLNVRFDPVGLPTLEEYNGNQYAKYILKKHIHFLNRSKTVTNVVMVNLDRDDPKIEVIGFPEHFPTNGCQSLTASGDDFFAKGNYKKAKELYLARLSCSEDEYTQQRIIACSQKIEDAERFDQLVITADNLYKEGDYMAAREMYRSAYSLNDNHPYVGQQLENCNAQLDSQINYTYSITKAEEKEAEYLFVEAIALYQEALIIKPQDPFAQKKIEELKGKVVSETYKDHLEKGNALYKTGNYEAAKAAYLQAQQFEERNRELQELIQACDTEISFVKIRNEANSLYEQENFKEAKELYQRAAEFKPKDKELDQKIVACNQGLKYHRHKEMGDKLFFQSKYYLSAKEQYEEAIKAKPGDVYLQGQIQKCLTEHQKQEMSPQAIAKKLDNSVKLWNRKKYAECFSLLYEIEDSNMLQSWHYFMLGEIALANRNSLRNKMDWNKDQAISIGAYFMAKALEDEDSKYYLSALKRYCDLRAGTIQALNLKNLDCSKIDKE